MRYFITQILISALVVTPLSSFARVKPSAGQPRRGSYLVRGKPYLVNCPDILNVAPDNYDRALVDSAKTEGQVLQLLYDGGLVFSKLYFQAFLFALSKRKRDMRALSGQFYKRGNFNAQLRQKLRMFAYALVEVAQLPQPELDQFIWQILEAEKTAASVADNSDTKANEVRFQQVSSLIAAIEGSPNRALVEKTLRDVVSQSLLQSASKIMKRLSEQYRNTVNWNLTLATSFIGSLSTAVLGAALTPQPPTLHSVEILTGTLLTALFGMPIISVVKSARDRWIARKLGKQVKDIKKERVVFVLPKGSAPERVAMSKLLKEFLALDEDTGTESPNTAVAISEVCESNTCELTPVQIAYAGAVDLLELEALFQRLRDSISVKPASENGIREALSSVIQDPNDYGKAMILRAELKKYSDAITLAFETKQGLLNELDIKIKKLKTDFAVLRNKPFNEIRTTREDQARGLLLVNRVNADLAQLDRLIWDVNNFKATLEFSKRNAEIANVWLDSLPMSFTGWGEAASNILLQLDQLEAGK